MISNKTVINRLAVLVVGIGMFLSGCTRVMTNSLFDINNEYDIDGQVWQIQQTRLMHINGLSPTSELGEIYFLNPARGVETAFPVLPQDKNITLYKKVIDYNETNVTMSDLHEIKSTLLQLDKLSLDIAQKEVKLLITQEGNATNKENLIV